MSVTWKVPGNLLLGTVAYDYGPRYLKGAKVGKTTCSKEFETRLSNSDTKDQSSRFYSQHKGGGAVE